MCRFILHVLATVLLAFQKRNIICDLCLLWYRIHLAINLVFWWDNKMIFQSWGETDRQRQWDRERERELGNLPCSSSSILSGLISLKNKTKRSSEQISWHSLPLCFWFLLHVCHICTINIEQYCSRGYCAGNRPWQYAVKHKHNACFASIKNIISISMTGPFERRLFFLPKHNHQSADFTGRWAHLSS